MQTSKYHIERAELLLESAAKSLDAGGQERAVALAGLAHAHAQVALAVETRDPRGLGRGF